MGLKAAHPMSDDEFILCEDGVMNFMSKQGYNFEAITDWRKGSSEGRIITTKHFRDSGRLFSEIAFLLKK